MGIVFTPYPIDILTANFQIQGEFRPRGNPNVFVNDAQYNELTINDAMLKPIMPGAKFGPLNTAELYLPKREVQVMTLQGFPVAEAQLMATKLRLICFTDTYIIRGDFHAGPE